MGNIIRNGDPRKQVKPECFYLRFEEEWREVGNAAREEKGYGPTVINWENVGKSICSDSSWCVCGLGSFPLGIGRVPLT